MRFLTFLLFLLFCVFALWARWYFVCQVRGHCGEQDERLHTLRLTDGDSTVILDQYDQFAFDTMSVVPRLNANNEAFLDTLAAILLADTSRDLTITGFIRPSEKNWKPERGFFENIGVARADAIRSLLVKRGVPEGRISLDYKQSTDPDLLEPLTFSLFDPRGGPDDYNRTAFVFTNMTFSDANFEFNSAEFRPGTQAVLYADSVKTYLGLNAGKILTIVGHTDSKGTDKYNYDLGLKRAENAREYFRELGVTADIGVESKGEKEPVAPNSINGKDSPENRQKNRRVNFIIE
ncbi:MAG: OmpA family protein [Saprospiraceae bacterium]|nr:OmpA family protein [Lewinella sp.]